eukprot:jgi/Chlat1/5642/Chrsp369S05387
MLARPVEHCGWSQAVTVVDEPKFVVQVSVPDWAWERTQGLSRSVRAVHAFAFCTQDYKLTLRGVDKDSSEYRTLRSQCHQRCADRLLGLCQANGGIYVKAGQFLASISGMPNEYVKTLSVLQDKAPFRPFEEMDTVFRKEFNCSAVDMYAEFDRVPIAAASLAQVHRAKTFSGDEVAVKIQYPRMDIKFNLDVGTMSKLAHAVEWLFPLYRCAWIVPEFESFLNRELNFVEEGRNAEKVAANFKDRPEVQVPRIHWPLTTSTVLTMQYMEGIKITDRETIEKYGIDKEKVVDPHACKLLATVFAEMVYCHAFVHGDPHPGNILVRKSSNNAHGMEIVLLDHGLYFTLSNEFRRMYCQLWKSIILRDQATLSKLSRGMGVKPEYEKFLPLIFTARMQDSKAALGQSMSKEERDRLREETKDFTLADMSVFVEQLPRELLQVIRTNGLLRSINRQLGVSDRHRLFVNAHYAVKGFAYAKYNCVDTYLPPTARAAVWAQQQYLSLRLHVMELALKVYAMSSAASEWMSSLVHYWFHSRTLPSS